MVTRPPNRPIRSGQSPNPLRKFNVDNQDLALIKRTFTHVKHLLTTGEKILYIAIQEPLIWHPFPESLVLTDKRLIIYKPKLFGGVRLQDFSWRKLKEARLYEGRLRSTFRLKTSDDKDIRVDDLPKVQARKLYAFAHEKEESIRKEKRLLKMEENRAAAGGVVLNGNLPFSGGSSGLPEDPVERLKKLKRMKDMKLITAQEFEEKKAEILSQM